MKVKIKPELCDEIRQAIRDCKQSLDGNKQERKRLIKLISELKINIRAGEHYASKMQTAGIDEWYIRAELSQKNKNLQELRHQFVTLSAIHEVELARFRAMHRQLDKFGVPFDVERHKQSKCKKD